MSHTEDPDTYAVEDASEDSAVSVVIADRGDDIGFICGKVDAAPTYWVIIHAPRGNRAMSSDLGMNRLRRHAGEGGRAVAIATRSPALAARARAAAIPVASRPEFVRWDAPGKVVVHLGGRSLAFPSVGRYVQLALLLVAVGAVSWLALAMGPSAHVVVRPEATLLTRTVQVRASPEAEEVDLDTLEAPLTEVTESILITIPLTVTGSVPEPVEPSSVSLTVQNTTASAVTVTAGTLALAAPQGHEFSTLEERTIPAGATDAIPARSVLPGAAQNVAAGAINAWADPRPGLTVTNPQPAVGGADRDAPAVSADDIVRLRALEESVRTSVAIRELIANGQLEHAIFVQTATVEGEEVEPLPEPGTPTDLLLIPFRITVTASAIDAAVVERIAGSVLSEDAGDGVLIPGSARATEVPGTSVESGGALTATFEISGRFAAGVDEAAIEDAVKGKSAGSARSTVQERYGIEDVEVDLTPGWAPWVPRFGFRIDVDVSGSESSVGPAAGAQGTRPEEEDG